MRYLIVFAVLILLLCMHISSAQAVKPRIGVAGISHESNSFFLSKTVLADFNARTNSPPEETLREWARSKSTVSGYVEGARRYDLETLSDSLQQLISCGVYPERQRILVAKGAIAPRAAYEPIAGRIIEVDTPGVTAVNPARFSYKLARRPLFGLDQTEK